MFSYVVSTNQSRLHIPTFHHHRRHQRGERARRLALGMRNRLLLLLDKVSPQYLSVPVPAVMQNAVVLYRCTITFSNTVSTNHKSPRLRIPTWPTSSARSSPAATTQL